MAELAPWEPEETVGKIWHGLASRFDPPARFPEAGVAFDAMRSRIGLALRAIRDGEVAAQSVGVSTTRTKLVVYTFSAFAAGLVGAIFFLQAGRISPDSAFALLDWTAFIIFIVVTTFMVLNLFIGVVVNAMQAP